MIGKNSTSNELVLNSKLLNIIMKKIKKEKHEHLYPEIKKDGTLKECKRLFKKGASPKVLTEVLTKLGELPEEQEKHYKCYYTQRFLPVLKEEIKQSKKLEEIKKEKIEQVISEITSQSSNKDHSNNIAQSRRGSMESKTESGYGSDAGGDHNASRKHSISSANTISEDQEVENDGITSNSEDSGIESGNSSEAEDDHADEKDHISGIPISHTANENQEVEMNSNVQYTDEIFKAIKNGSQREFEEYLENCTDISSAKDDKGNNILHLIVMQLEKEQKFDLLDEKKQKFKFLNIVLDVSKKKGKEQLKAQLEKAVNDKNGNGQTPLQALLLSKVTKEKHSPLKKLIPHYDNTIVSAIRLLKLGANIDDLQLSEEELHGLGKEQKIYYLNFLEELVKSVRKSKLEPEIKTNTETKIKEIIGYTINTPDSNPLHLAINKKDKELFEELLQKGADISLKDTNGNNALHHIALLLKREQKVAYLELILNLVEKGVISKDKLKEAINATNQEENTPLQVALKAKARKGGTKYLKKGKIFDPTVSYSNTTKFCAMLLEKGADPRSLELEGEEFDTRKYYLTLYGLKNYPKTPHKAREKARELKEELEKEYHCKTPLKKCQSGVKRTGFSIGKAASTIIHKGPASAIMFAVIGIATAAAFNGAMAPVAAICIIVAAISAYFVFTSRSRIKEFLKKSSNETKDHVDNKQQKKHARRPKSAMKDTSTKSPADVLTI